MSITAIPTQREHYSSPSDTIGVTKPGRDLQFDLPWKTALSKEITPFGQVDSTRSFHTDINKFWERGFSVGPDSIFGLETERLEGGTISQFFEAGKGYGETIGSTRPIRNLAQVFTGDIQKQWSSIIEASVQPIVDFEPLGELAHGLTNVRSMFSKELLEFSTEILEVVKMLTALTEKFESQINSTVAMLKECLIEADYYDVEDYLGSEAETKFTSLVLTNVPIALLALEELVQENVEFEGSLPNILISLSTIRDHGSINHRRNFVEKQLLSKNKFVRDSSGTALSFINDKESIPALLEAIENENYKGLKEDFQAVLRQIEELGDGPILPDGN